MSKSQENDSSSSPKPGNIKIQDRREEGSTSRNTNVELQSPTETEWSLLHELRNAAHSELVTSPDEHPSASEVNRPLNIGKHLQLRDHVAEQCFDESPTCPSWSLVQDNNVRHNDNIGKQCISLPSDISSSNSPSPENYNSLETYNYVPNLEPGPMDDSDSEKIKNSIKSAWNNMKYGKFDLRRF